MWPRTDFLQLLGLTHPIVQAPMSGFTPPTLVATVCNAGGMGSIGCVGQPSDVVREQVATVRQTTNRPFNLNFFAHTTAGVSPEATVRMRARLAPYFGAFGLGPVPEPKDLFSSFNAELLDLVGRAPAARRQLSLWSAEGHGRSEAEGCRLHHSQYRHHSRRSPLSRKERRRRCHCPRI